MGRGREKGKNQTVELWKIESKCYDKEIFKHFISYIQHLHMGPILFWFFSRLHEIALQAAYDLPGCQLQVGKPWYKHFRHLMNRNLLLNNYNSLENTGMYFSTKTKGNWLKLNVQKIKFSIN